MNPSRAHDWEGFFFVDPAQVWFNGVMDIFNFLQVTEDIGTAGQPTREQLVEIQAAGTQTVINLALADSPDAIPDEGERVRALGMEYIHIPVVWEQPTRGDLERFFAVMRERTGRKVFVHCVMNMRVSAFVYLYRVLVLGAEREAARLEMEKIWQPNEVWGRFIDENLMG